MSIRRKTFYGGLSLVLAALFMVSGQSPATAAPQPQQLDAKQTLTLMTKLMPDRKTWSAAADKAYAKLTPIEQAAVKRAVTLTSVTETGPEDSEFNAATTGNFTGHLEGHNSFGWVLWTFETAVSWDYTGSTITSRPPSDVPYVNTSWGWSFDNYPVYFRDWPNAPLYGEWLVRRQAQFHIGPVSGASQYAYPMMEIHVYGNGGYSWTHN